MPPGTSKSFDWFFHTVINDLGQTNFYGYRFDEQGIWSEGSGTLALVAHAGDNAPGTEGEFFFFDDPSFNNSGQTAFLGGFTDSVPFSDVNRGIWTEGNGSLALVALEGGEAPGTDRLFSALSLPILNDLGQTAFQGGFGSSNADEGIWAEKDGSLAVVAIKGDEAPGTNSTFSKFERGSLRFNNAGQTAFRATLAASRGYSGIWSEGSGSLNLVALEGNRAPGTNAYFRSFWYYSPVINDTGKIAFQAHLFNEGGSFGTNDYGIWSEKKGPLALVARTGERAPGTDAVFDSDLGSAFGGLSINREGEIAFRATVAPPSGNESSFQSGIWSEEGDSLSLVALEGSRAPGTNVEFVDFRKPIFNDAGQTAFRGMLSGADVDTSNDGGIWAQDLSGVLTLIAREGDLLEVDDGPETDYRTIRDVFFLGGASGGALGRGSGFNNRGQVAFYATFTDGTNGIFVSNLVAIPEPASSMLLFTALAMCGARRCTNRRSGSE